MPKYVIHLEKYRNKEDNELGKADLTIFPAPVNGLQLPPIERMLIEQPQPKYKVNMKNLSEAHWYPKIKIDTQMPVADYIAVVNWWFESAKLDAEYVLLTKSTYASFKPMVLDNQTLLAKAWLLKRAGKTNAKTKKFNGRKKDLDSFLSNWLTRQLNYDSNLNSGKKW